MRAKGCQFGVVENVDEFTHGGLGEVAAFTVLPFLVLFLQNRADQAGGRVPVGEDLHDVGAALDLPVESLDGII